MIMLVNMLMILLMIMLIAIMFIMLLHSGHEMMHRSACWCVIYQIKSPTNSLSSISFNSGVKFVAIKAPFWVTFG